METTHLTTHNLSIGYQSPPRLFTAARHHRVIATSLNLELRAGELVCLLGPNGAGKTTLLRTLAGMLPPMHGQVCIAGIDIATIQPRDLAQRLSVVLTERIDAGNLSVTALVALGRHPHTDWLGTLTPRDQGVVEWAIQATGALHLAQRQVSELSDGERQRVMIARALAQQPLVMILDEPTAFLDLPSRVEVMRLLRSLTYSTQRALLLSTHDLDLALRSADLLWLMAPNGTMHTGAPEDLVLNGAFETAFHHERVRFDQYTGTFSINTQTSGSIDVRGSGLAVTWTTRALERAGFQVIAGHSGQPDAPIQVEVSVSNGHAYWQSTLAGTTRIHSSVYELVRFLREATHEPEQKATERSIA